MTYSVVNLGDERGEVFGIIHTSPDGGQQVIAMDVTPGYADKIASFLNTESEKPAAVEPEGQGGLLSPYQVIINILKRDKSTDDILAWMEQEGISLNLNWGEEDKNWECDFINGRGKRFSANGSTLRKGIRGCIKLMAERELGMKPVQFKSLEDY
jgi:hypothetical protein